MKVKCKCSTCGKVFYRQPSEAQTKHLFCSIKCSKVFTSKRMSEYNKNTNPMNKKGGQSLEHRLKQRERKKTITPNNHKTYTKFLGRHMHRVMAEIKIGRPLKTGEVVHHIDGDKQNNNIDNLMIFKNQQEHARYHMQIKKGIKNGNHKSKSI